MNETSKTQQYRNFRTTLKAVAASLNAIAVHTSHMNDGEFQITDKSDAKLELTVIYRNSERLGGERLTVYSTTVDKTADLTNLSPANLKRHIAKRLANVRKYFLELDADEALHNAEHDARDVMAKKLGAVLLGDGFKVLPNPDDDIIWRSSSLGTVKFGYATGTLNTERGYDFTYNVKYDFTISGTAIKGELDALTLEGITKPLRALYTL